MDQKESERAERFFRLVREEFCPPGGQARSIVITHLLNDRPALLEAINESAPIAALLPKPKTVSPLLLAWIKHRFRIHKLSRDMFRDEEKAVSFFQESCQNSPFIILDIGGYASGIQKVLADRFAGRYLGAIEDTENGFRRYEAALHLPLPVIHVARSPLKNPEDYLVGQSIVYSVEALLREQGDIFHGRTACVVGYGKIGASIAALLHARHVRTVIFDRDPIKQIDAMSHGFSVAPTIDDAIKNAGLLFCATGQVSLKEREFLSLDNGAYIATVTSSDDELDLTSIKSGYEIHHTSEFITRYRRKGQYFYILNRGQAVNFIHGASVGPFIYLVHAEILASLGRLLQEQLAAGLHENSSAIRGRIARLWYNAFGPRNWTGQ
jgi:adenosylhomocysteinase